MSSHYVSGVFATVATLSLISMGAAGELADIEYVYGNEWHDCPEYAFSQPGRLALAPTGDVFVVDENLSRLTEWTWCGSYKRAWKHLDEVETFSGIWFGPGEITAGPRGDVYMACDKEVRRYAADGTFLGAWLAAGEEDASEVDAIAAGPGGDVYVLLPKDRRVRYFTPEGIRLGEWIVPGQTTSEVYTLCDVAVAPRTCYVYVADEGNARVQYFTAAGSFLGEWGSAGAGRGQFSGPLRLAVAPNGTVFVADADNNRVQYFTATGLFLNFLGYVDPQSSYYRFEYPADIDVGVDGTVYVADSGDNRVVYYKPRAEDK